MDVQRIPSDAPTDLIVDALERDGAAHDGLSAGGGYLGSVRVQDPLELLATGDL